MKPEGGVAIEQTTMKRRVSDEQETASAKTRSGTSQKVRRKKETGAPTPISLRFHQL